MRDYFPRNEFKDKGFSEVAIRVLEKVAIVAEALKRLEAAQGRIDNLDTATDALNELIEDANLTLEALDARIDQQENGNGPYVKKTGDTMSGALNVNAALQCNSLRVNTAAVAGTITPTHTLTINVNGTPYRIPLAV